ncbi:organic solute transporter subunit alpha [Conger conger]|uniref:organic solute transporter subunit alpha n=1 Tax=Conger conger TaxID=82655 RepID=UPI002A59832E|nr:organic solute transporter subunit alpha [Conger conger]
MSRGSNCSWPGAEIPLSSEFFSVIRKDLWLFLIPAGLAVIMLLLFLEETGFFYRHVSSSRRRRLSLWILGLYPALGMTSITALYVPRSSSLCNFIASLYHSITLFKFMGLITDFFGGKARMHEALAGQQVAPDPCPCCCCCCLPFIAINSFSVGWMTFAVIQLSVVRTVLFFLMLVLWTDEQYDYGDVDSVNPNVYVNAIIGVSTFLSFYGYLLFYKATKRALKGFGLRAKFICIIVVLVLCGLQSGILETMGALKVIPCSPPFSDLMRSQLIYHYSVIVEMFCISLFARHIFRKVEPSLEDHGVEPGSEEGLGAEQLPRKGQEMCVQTEEEWPTESQTRTISEQLWPGSGASNPGYNSDSEESLCRIEHAPLDRFTFPMKAITSPSSSQPASPERRDISPGETPSVTLGTGMQNSETREATIV